MAVEVSKNQSVVSANVADNQFGLKVVEFVCEGSCEWPTALNAGNSPKGVKWTLLDDPKYAFRNGEAAPKYPPEFSYHRQNRTLNTFACRSVLFRDGTPYVAEEAARAITEADKKRVFAASCQRNDAGLIVVEFKGVGYIGGMPIYPTALATGKSLDENPLDAFWGGEASAHLPHSANFADVPTGWVWSARTILNPDGSALSTSTAKKLRGYKKIVNFPYPGKCDVDYTAGALLYPPVEIPVIADVEEFVCPKSALAATLEVPYHVREWACFNVTYTPADSKIARQDGCGARGYLAGAISSIGNKYKGMDVKNTVSTLVSEPTYAVFAANMKAGKLIMCECARDFTDDSGNEWFIVTKATAKVER